MKEILAVIATVLLMSGCAGQQLQPENQEVSMVVLSSPSIDNLKEGGDPMGVWYLIPAYGLEDARKRVEYCLPDGTVVKGPEATNGSLYFIRTIYDVDRNNDGKIDLVQIESYSPEQKMLGGNGEYITMPEQFRIDLVIDDNFDTDFGTHIWDFKNENGDPVADGKIDAGFCETG